MDIMNVVLIIVAAVFISAIFIFIKKAAKIILSLLFLALLLLIIFSVFVYLDFKDMKDNFFEKSNIVLIKEGGKLSNGFAFEKGDIDLFNEARIENYSGYLAEWDYDKALGFYYKLIIIDSDVADIQADAQELNEEAAEKVLDIFKDPILLLKNIKNGKIIIYPETAVFKAMRIMPLSLIKSALESIFAKIKGV